MNELIDLILPTGQRVCAIKLDPSQDYLTTLNSIGLEGPSPVLVLIGGASNMSDKSLSRLSQLFVEVLAPAAEQVGACVVDGGTDAGVIQMMGKARRHIGAKFKLIGIAPEGKVNLPHLSPAPDEDYERKELEPHHTHFVLIPGSQWGDESPWLARTASELAGGAPSITLLINGGKIALVDLLANIEAGRSAIVVAGSGRLADKIARAIRFPDQSVEQPIANLLQKIQKDQLTLFDLSSPLDELTDLLRQRLTS